MDDDGLSGKRHQALGFEDMEGSRDIEARLADGRSQVCQADGERLGASRPETAVGHEGGDLAGNGRGRRAPESRPCPLGRSADRVEDV